ncbi:MAG: SDR family NAD(P)-dependent oxidoreductase [Deltaproteobacteria bacterium]|nr:SDR family NAD(P)-dependent oxidoreductase [Deltaproteobacteria bacterium]
MKVLLTGGSGFLGSHIAEELVAAGHTIRALARKTSRVDDLKRLGAEIALGDAGDVESLKAAVRGVDAVVHNAGLTKARSLDEFEAVNGQGTRNVVEAVRAENPGVSRVLYVSSIAAHGPSPDGHLRDEDEPATPVSYYGRSKLSGEEAIRALAGVVPFSIVRPPIIYGPRDKDVLTMFKAVKRGIILDVGPKGGKVSAVYAPDAARAIGRVLVTPAAANKTYFIGDGNTYGIVEMGRAMAAALGGLKPMRLPIPTWFVAFAARMAALFGAFSKAPKIFTPDKVAEMKQRFWVFSADRLARDVGYRAEHNFTRGAEKTIAWYRDNKWL